MSAAVGEVGSPPDSWATDGDARTFDRALAYADWNVAGQSGVTGADGQLVIPGLAAGRYTLDIRKTLGGNLLPLSVPIVIGSDGESRAIVEVGQGVARTRLSYSDNGVAVVEIHAPYGTQAVLRDGQLRQLHSGGRVWIDADGDGRFDGGSCTAPEVWACPEDQTCSLEIFDERYCQCVSSCQFCDDCVAPGACVSTGTPPLYRCSDERGCGAGDRCVCLPSCPDCRDCVQRVCVPGCDPVEISKIIIEGTAQLVQGRGGFVRASAELSDGVVIDITSLVTWSSSNESVATVGAWGQVRAAQIGTTQITARLGTIESAPFDLDVVERAALQRIRVQNAGCFCGPIFFDALRSDILPPCYFAAASDALAYLPPWQCRQTVLPGATIQFLAIAEFADGSVQDITTEASWWIEPAQVGTLVKGLFTAQLAGSARIIASVGNLLSEPVDVNVVTEASVESLSIHPQNWGYDTVRGGPLVADASQPCFDCGVSITVLRGDTLGFQATAHYDTGEWRDVTSQVTWRTSNDSVASVGNDGVMKALQAGAAQIDATLATVSSNRVDVSVVNEASVVGLSIYQEGTDRVVAKGDDRFFRASAYYDVGFARDVTRTAVWRSSDDSIGAFSAAGTFTGKRAGVVRIWAELDGQASETIGLEVFELSELAYCDVNNINRNSWSDPFNRVVLESDCGTYSSGELVTLRYTVTETVPHGGIFDPCLDLYVYQGERRVRTIREEGCGEPFLPNAAPGRDEAALKYQLRAFWDLKDENGAAVPPGRYTIFGRFYLYYDPVVRIDVIVGGEDDTIPCELNRCGNGCGYVRTCGGTPPAACPAVCRELCECPPGWGLAANGQCEACSDECCPEGAACPPGVARCAPPPPCCPNGTECADPARPPCPPACCPADDLALCPPGVPVCPTRCCSPGEVCPDNLPACELKCCSPGATCDAATLNACPCCPRGALCILALPPCPEVCCPRDTMCLPDVPPCESERPTPTPTPARPVCTPPACGAGEVIACPGNCPGGCGSICAAPTPLPPLTGGVCYLGSATCGGSFHPTAQERCCSLYRQGATAAAVSWCPVDAVDEKGQCLRCADNPCAGLMVNIETPTPRGTPTPTAFVSPRPTDLPTGRCRRAADCNPNFQICLEPGGYLGCGICYSDGAIDANFERCTSDTDCNGTDPMQICEPLGRAAQTCSPCGGEGSVKVCLRGCESDASCADGEVCDAQRCRASSCSANADCPRTHQCSRAADGSARCSRRSCANDSECGGGYCVEGACYDTAGRCHALPA